jgi:hypothetical protein
MHFARSEYSILDQTTKPNDPALGKYCHLRIVCSSVILHDAKIRSLNSLWGSGIYFAFGYTNYINGECLRNR